MYNAIFLWCQHVTQPATKCQRNISTKQKQNTNVVLRNDLLGAQTVNN